MRLLILHHTPDQTPRIRDAARGAGATNVATIRLDGGDGGDERVTVLTVENPAVEDVVSVLEDVEAGLVLLPS